MGLITYLESNLFEIVALLARIAGLFLFMPGFSSKSINTKTKVMIAIALSILISSYTDIPPVNNIYSLALRLIAEFTGGTIIGFTSSLFMQTIQVIGGTIDNLLGTGIFQIPDTSGMISAISVKLIEYAALLLFFTTNTHLYIIGIISMDIDFLKLYPAFASGNFLKFAIEMLEFIFINGLHLAMPFILIFLLIDICLGIMNRSFQAFNVFSFSMPVKMLVFIVFLFYYIYFFRDNFGNLIAINMDLLEVFFNIINK